MASQLSIFWSREVGKIKRKKWIFWLCDRMAFVIGWELGKLLIKLIACFLE